MPSVLLRLPKLNSFCWETVNMKAFMSICSLIFTGGVVTNNGDYFVLRHGLANSKQVFESTGTGRVVFLEDQSPSCQDGEKWFVLN